jgi:hypothetical protein
MRSAVLDARRALVGEAADVETPGEVEPAGEFATRLTRPLPREEAPEPVTRVALVPRLIRDAKAIGDLLDASGVCIEIREQCFVV